MYCIRHYENSVIFSTLFFQVYTCIFTHIETLLRHIQTYSGIFNTMRNPCIFTTLSYHILNREAYLKQSETLTRHIQNSAIGHYLAIFITLWNPCICRNQAYTESWNIHENLQIFWTLTYLKPVTYSEPS